MRIFRGPIMLALIVGYSAGWITGARGRKVRERVKNKAERLKGRVELAVGEAVDQGGTQARSMVSGTAGAIRRNVSEIRDRTTPGRVEATG